MRTIQCLSVVPLFVFAAGVAAQTGQQTETDSFQVRIAVQGTCTVLTTTDIDFGTQVPNAGVHDQTGTVRVQCTKDTPFTLGLNGGSTTGNVSARAMVNTPIPPATPVQIPYTLSRDSYGGAIWGNDATANWYVGTGNGLGANFEIPLTVYARATLTGNEPAGAYADTVTATLTY